MTRFDVGNVYGSLSDKGVSEVKINQTSLYKIPTSRGYIGTLRFNNVKLGGGVLNGLNFHFIEDLDGVVFDKIPIIYGSESTLLKTHSLSLLNNKEKSKSYSSKYSPMTNILLLPEKNDFNFNQKKIVSHLTNSLDDIIDFLSPKLETRELKKITNKQIFGVCPNTFLSDTYCVDVEMGIGGIFEYFLTPNLSKLIRQSNK